MSTKTIALLPGTSTTGTPHGLLIETAKTPHDVKLTIVGHDGKKRHASIVMSIADIDAAIAALQSARAIVEA